jgi:glycosyltransferase involved in cell wall biosynthesis
MHLLLRPRFSGAEILARDLCRLQRQKHELAFAALDPSQPDFSPILDLLRGEGVEVHVPDQEGGRLARLGHLHRTFRAFRPDVVFAHSQIPMYYASLLQPFFRHALVKVIHNAAGETFGLVDWLLTPRGTHVIGVNQAHLARYATGSPKGIVAHFVPNGIDLEAFQNVHRGEGPSDRKIILQVGRICDMKGQLEALKALIRLGRSDLDFRLAGLVEDRAYLEEILTLSRSFAGRLEVLGGRADVPGLLCSADLILMPSAYEAHPMAYLEALASGRPVIANDIHTFRDQGTYQGVQFVLRADIESFARLINDCLGGPKYFERDLSGFDIHRTSNSYENIINIAKI